MFYQDTKTYASRQLGCMKENQIKRIYTSWLYLYETLENENQFVVVVEV